MVDVLKRTRPRVLLIAVACCLLRVQPALCDCNTRYSRINGSLCINSRFTETFARVFSECSCALLCTKRQRCQAFTIADGPCQLFAFDACSKSVRDCACSRRGQVFVKQRAGLEPGKLCPPGYGDDLCGIKYKITSNSGTWQTQLAKCQSESGNLVIMADVTDAAEMSQINSIGVKYSGMFFLGGYQMPGSIEAAGGWYWTACNISVDPSVWATGEPNNVGGTENALFKISIVPGLADFSDYGTGYYGLCECLSPFD